jgi:hypothetical protein
MVGGAVLTGVGAAGEAASWALNATGFGAVVGDAGGGRFGRSGDERHGERRGGSSEFHAGDVQRLGRNGCRKGGYPRDRATPNTKNWSAHFRNARRAVSTKPAARGLATLAPRSTPRYAAIVSEEQG